MKTPQAPTATVSTSGVALSVSANGAVPYQPGATPQERRTTTRRGLIARSMRRGVGPGFQPSVGWATDTQGVALGWYGAGALPLRRAARAALDAESAAVLETIKGLLK